MTEAMFLTPGGGPAAARLSESRFGRTLKHMATQIELIDKYKKELSRLKVKVDDVLLKAVVKSLGPAVYREDASMISAADAGELERVRQNFMIRRLGLADSPRLDAMLNRAIDQMGRSKTNKHRAVLYYIITRDSKREAALL